MTEKDRGVKDAATRDQRHISSEKRTRHRGRLVLFVVMALTVLSLALSPQLRQWFKEVVQLFTSGDFTVVQNFVASYGPWAALISCFLMIFQSVAAPLPAFLITFANAALFGWWKGALLSWGSAMLGAALCFYIARLLGRDVVERLASRTGIQSIEAFFKRYGDRSVLIARLLPFVSFDFVSYFAGLTPMSFKGFWIATGIGQAPATIIYSWVGGMLTGGARLMVTGLLIVFALALLVALLRSYWSQREALQQ